MEERVTGQKLVIESCDETLSTTIAAFKYNPYMKSFYWLFGALIFVSCDKLIQDNYGVSSSSTDVIFDLKSVDNLVVDSSIILERKLIVLEYTEKSMIGDIDKVLMTDDRILVLDKRVAKALFVFDHSGAFIKKMGEHGGGQGELGYLYDFDIDPYGNIYLLDIGLRKVIKFGKDLTYLGERRFNFNTFQFGYVDDNRFAFDQRGRSNGKMSDLHNLDYRLLVWDIMKGIDKRYFAYNKIYDVEGIMNLTSQNLYRSDSILLFNDPFTYDVYEITSDTLRKKYSFDFGSGNIPESYFNKSLGENLNEVNQLIGGLRTSRYVQSISNLYENERFFIAFFRKHDTPYLFLYSKISNRVLVKNGLEFPNKGIGLLPVGIYNKYLIGIIRYPEIEEIRGNFKNGSPKDIASLKADGLDLISTFGNNYNPIISIYKVKEF